MFKFMKSKKGFTLVELMIVVVIMAILVAVAVPIYSAVTKNARTKTCIDNMRSIASQVNTYSMNSANTTTGTGTITSNGDKGTVVAGLSFCGLDVTSFTNLFQALPYCPAGGTYTITVTKVDALAAQGGDAGVKVGVTCTGTDESASHIYGTAA